MSATDPAPPPPTAHEASKLYGRWYYSSYTMPYEENDHWRAFFGGVADAIVDLVSTGRTLKANGLIAVEEIMPVSARLIVNQAALKTKRAALQPLIDAFAKAARR